MGVAATAIGCAAAPEVGAALFNPAVDDWITQLGVAVGATVVSDFIEGGLKDAWRGWNPGVRKIINTHLRGPYRWYGSAAWVHSVPPVVAVQASTGKYSDPMTDQMIACVDYGEAAVVFETWAWQSISTFVHEQTHGQTGDQLAQARDLCVLTLIPSGTKPHYGRTPEGTAGWMTYESRNGAVEIVHILSNGRSRSVVTAYGMLDADGKATSRSFVLPSRAGS